MTDRINYVEKAKKQCDYMNYTVLIFFFSTVIVTLINDQVIECRDSESNHSFSSEVSLALSKFKEKHYRHKFIGKNRSAGSIEPETVG